MKHKSLKKNAVYSFIKAFMNLVFPLISFPYASRILLADGIGKVNFANSIIEYFVMVATLGIGGYATREATRFRDDKTLLNKFCKEILIINLVSTAVAYFLLLISFVFISKFSEYRMLLIVCSTKILFTTIGMDWLYNAHEEYKYITVRSVFFQLLSLVLLFTCVKTKDDYVTYALMGVFSSVGSNICNIFYSRKFFNFFEKTKIELKKHLRPILIFFGMTCASKFHTALDSVMLGFMLNDVSVGYYSAANKIRGLVEGVITAVIYTFMPRSSYYLEKNQMNEYNALVSRTVNISLFFSIPASVGIIVIARPLILLFSGEDFLGALPSMIIMAPIVFTAAISSAITNVILTPKRLERYILYSEIIGFVLNIILNAILIPICGVFGAGLATLIVESVITLYRFIFSFSSLKNCHIFKNLVQIIISCAIMYISLLFILRIINNAFIEIIVSTILGSMIYALCMLALRNESACYFSKEIIKRIKK